MFTVKPMALMNFFPVDLDLDTASENFFPAEMKDCRVFNPSALVNFIMAAEYSGLFEMSIILTRSLICSTTAKSSVLFGLEVFLEDMLCPLLVDGSAGAGGCGLVFPGFCCAAGVCFTGVVVGLLSWLPAADICPMALVSTTLFCFGTFLNGFSAEELGDLSLLFPVGSLSG